MSNMDLSLRKKPFKAYTKLPTQLSNSLDFVTTDVNEELLFASKFFENLQMEDDKIYWMGLALQKEVGWVALSYHYFGIIPDTCYRHLIFKRKNCKTDCLDQYSVKLSDEWKENPLKLFKEFWG